MRKTFLHAVLVNLVLAVWLLLPTICLAQARTTGRVTGRVFGSDGSPFEGATVTATSIDLGLELEMESDAGGRFQFVNLKVGDWSVAVTALGMQPQVINFRLALDEGAKIALGTDSHALHELGDFRSHRRVLAEVGVSTPAQLDAILFRLPPKRAG